MSAGTTPAGRPYHGRSPTAARSDLTERQLYEGRHRGNAPLRHHPSRFPAGLIVAIVILLVVVIVVIALVLGGTFHSPSGNSGGGPIVLANAGDMWTISGTEYRATMFTTSSNGTFFGNFSVNGSAGATVIIVLMNESEEDRFANTSVLVGFYDSGRVDIGELNVTLAPAGNFYFYVYNPNSQSVTVNWQSTVEYVPAS